VNPLRRVCVYCGSNPGSDGVYRDAARRLADELVARGAELVYGGAAVGIMGIIADRVLEQGGRVHGVIPRFLMQKEIAHTGLTEQHVVDTMHERKTTMAELADAFIALPGGYGTLEEIVEAVTWGQLRMHRKPCGLLNVAGYFDHLIRYLEHAVAEGFLKPVNRAMLLVDDDPAHLLERFAAYAAPTEDKWTTTVSSSPPASS